MRFNTREDKTKVLDGIANAAQKFSGKIKTSKLDERTLNMHFPTHELKQIEDRINNLIKSIEKFELNTKLRSKSH